MSFDPVHLPEKDEIFASVDEAALNGWHRSLYDLFDDVQSQIEAYRSAGTAGEDWLRRAAGKVAATKRAIRWVERRMAECGFDLPPTRAGREGDIIRALKARMRRLEGELAELRSGGEA